MAGFHPKSFPQLAEPEESRVETHRLRRNHRGEDRPISGQALEHGARERDVSESPDDFRYVITRVPSLIRKMHSRETEGAHFQTADANRWRC